MSVTSLTRLRLFVFLAVGITVAACGSGDADGTASGLPAEEVLPPGLDPALALSPDPVDQMNFLLGKAVRAVPGEPFEVRYQLRRLSADSVAFDYEQHRAGEPWPPAPARAVALLSDIQAEVHQGRGVRITCDASMCMEYQAFVDSLSFPRLPEGPDGDWFRTLVAELAAGSQDVPSGGDEDAINQRLEESELYYSETVRTWYQVAFDGDWMSLSTWQQAEGFPVNRLPGTLRAYLPDLEERAPGVFGCRAEHCVLDVEDTPFQVVLESDEEAARFVDFFNRLGEQG